MTSNWICFQLGAREHYAIPRAFQKNDQLTALITDVWVYPDSLTAYVPSSRLIDRFHIDLASSNVYHNNGSSLFIELVNKFRNLSDWDKIIIRNKWFQKYAVKQLERISSEFHFLETPPIIFCYSYAALDILSFAKQHNWITVLGQIDPGLVEEQIVAQLHNKSNIGLRYWQPAPKAYWENWRKELDLADRVIVNSTWSQKCLTQAGIDPDKMRIVPLAFHPTEEAVNFRRSYPTSFTLERPLRVLFLGSVILRKGILPLLQAFDLLFGKPVELWLVGNVESGIYQEWLHNPQVRWIGNVTRSEVVDYYRLADVFILPTYSDGFALTQLEALAWKLPLIVSSNCGDVVQDNVNGFLLKELSVEYIITTLEKCLASPSRLLRMSSMANIKSFSLDRFRQNMVDACCIDSRI